MNEGSYSLTNLELWVWKEREGEGIVHRVWNDPTSGHERPLKYLNISDTCRDEGGRGGKEERVCTERINRVWEELRSNNRLREGLLIDTG
jgi:hypothetical protein